MLDYWTSFVRTGAPKAADAPNWPDFGAGGGVLIFQAGPKAYADLFPGMYALNEQVVCRRRASGDVPWNWNGGLASPPLPAKIAGC